MLIPDHALVNLGVALGIGILIGAEREQVLAVINTALAKRPTLSTGKPVATDKLSTPLNPALTIQNPAVFIN